MLCIMHFVDIHINIKFEFYSTFFFVICEDLSHESTTNEETTHFELLTKEPFHVKGNNYTFDNSAFLNRMNKFIFII